MSTKSKKVAEEPADLEYKPGDLVKVQFSKTRLWPSRIAKTTEVSDAIKSSQKPGQDYLIYYFGSKNYSWVRRSQIEPWKPDEVETDEASKKARHRSKAYEQGVEEAKEWAESTHVFPVYQESAEEEEEEVKPTDRRRKAKDVEEEAPTPKRPRGRPPSVPTGEEEMLSSSDEDAPYKVPYADEKKARKMRVMRKMGLCPPDGSLFKAPSSSSGTHS